MFSSFLILRLTYPGFRELTYARYARLATTIGYLLKRLQLAEIQLRPSLGNYCWTCRAAAGDGLCHCLRRCAAVWVVLRDCRGVPDFSAGRIDHADRRP